MFSVNYPEWRRCLALPAESVQNTLFEFSRTEILAISCWLSRPSPCGQLVRAFLQKQWFLGVFEWLCVSKKLEMQIVTTINKLPPELLERIFSMLSFSDRKTAVLVCRFLVHFSICFWFVIWNMTISFVVRECFAKKYSCSFGFCPNEIKGVYFLSNANNLIFKLF